MLLLEDKRSEEEKILLVDFLKPVKGGHQAWIFSAFRYGKPVGVWRLFDQEKNVWIEKSPDEILKGKINHD